VEVRDQAIRDEGEEVMARRRQAKHSRRPKRRRARKWIQGAINPKHKGWLHRALGVPQGKKISMRLLLKAKHMGGVTARRAQFAINMRRVQKRRRRK
jgi:hypothetical protein